MRAIFISYRREDSEGQAGRIFADLTRQFGEDAVFMDVAGIEPGRDFRRALDQHVASCGVLLAVIGRNWVGVKNESGQRRLDNPMDFVRLETVAALKRDIPVVPVLVQGATIPCIEDLPEDLRDLAFRAGIPLTHVHWDSDIRVLIKALRSYLQTAPAPIKPVAPAAPAPVDPPAVASAALTATARSTGPRRWRSRRTVLAAAVGFAVIAVAVYLWYANSENDDGSTRAEAAAALQTPVYYETETAAATLPTPVYNETQFATTASIATPSVARVTHQAPSVDSSTSPGVARAALQPRPTSPSLRGLWQGNGVVIRFTEDARANIDGVCVTGCRSGDVAFLGSYESADRASIAVISRNREFPACGVIRQVGTLTFLSADEIEISADAWNGDCGLALTASTSRLRRMPDDRKNANTLGSR
jgi:hypothetical protein